MLLWMQWALCMQWALWRRHTWRCEVLETLTSDLCVGSGCKSVTSELLPYGTNDLWDTLVDTGVQSIVKLMLGKVKVNDFVLCDALKKFVYWNHKPVVFGPLASCCHQFANEKLFGFQFIIHGVGCYNDTINNFTRSCVNILICITFLSNIANTGVEEYSTKLLALCF
jgi:hypothetical protein